jgi:hypothetical protein
MRNDHRFASLKGASRKWLMAEEFEADADPACGTPPLDGELEHDGWSPIGARRPPLARLGDVLRLRGSDSCCA